jgi:hypothetical protein
VALFAEHASRFDVGSVRNHPDARPPSLRPGPRNHAEIEAGKSYRNTTAPCAFVFREPVHSKFAQARFAFLSVFRVVSLSVAFATPFESTLHAPPLAAILNVWAV